MDNIEQDAMKDVSGGGGGGSEQGGQSGGMDKTIDQGIHSLDPVYHPRSPSTIALPRTQCL